MRRLLTPPTQAWEPEPEPLRHMENMEEILRALEQALASFLCRSRQHDCILEDGVCHHCEHFWYVRESFEYEIMIEKDELALLLALQSKQRIACLCRGIEGTSLHDNIVSLSLIIHGQQ